MPTLSGSTSSLSPHAAPAREPAARQVGAPLSVVLVDDNRMLREGLAAMILARRGFALLGAAGDGEAALEQVRASRPDVVLLDSGLAEHDILGLTATICAESPESQVVIMGLLLSQDDVTDLVRAGASGFVMKDASLEDLFQAIRTVAAGGKVLPAGLTTSLFTRLVTNVPLTTRDRAPEELHLTRRERQVVDLLGAGLCNKEIATRLEIAVHTVKSHVHNVLEKLALHSRLELAASAHGQGRRPEER